MRRLVGRIRPYAWGSRTGIATIQGRSPSDGPEAELWLGAHPDDPSLVDDTDLLSLVEADPVVVLGSAVVDRYGPRLPFLLKLIAAEQPLSLQVHPDLEQARKGFAAEEAAAVPRDAPYRNYVDANHKPELLLAVTAFDALCGFRTAAESAASLRRLGIPALDSIVDTLGASPPESALRRAVTGLFELPTGTDLVAQVRAASAALAAEPEAPPEYALAVELVDRYPGDVGVLVTFLLNRVRLHPGEAIYMPAGNLHTYLRGVGLELMASSDNVLRGGLTPKHVDVDELLRILRYEELAEPRVSAVPVDAAGGPDDAVWWPTPAPDFRLTRAYLRGGPLRLPVPGDAGPRIVFCLTGRVRVRDADGEVELGPGEAAFAAASSGAVTAVGDGELYQASVGSVPTG